jgi:hypothetical protein
MACQLNVPWGRQRKHLWDGDFRDQAAGRLT